MPSRFRVLEMPPFGLRRGAVTGALYEPDGAVVTLLDVDTTGAQNSATVCPAFVAAVVRFLNATAPVFFGWPLASEPR
jgi:hypothetical protein